jgi:hypothetical protein
MHGRRNIFWRTLHWSYFYIIQWSWITGVNDWDKYLHEECNIKYCIIIYRQEREGISFFHQRHKQQLHRLCNPEPDLLKEVSGNLLWPNLSIHGCLSRPDVGLGGLDKGFALKDLPEEVEDNVDGDTDVSGDEVIDAPLALGEDCKSVEEQDHAEVGQGDVCGPWLPLALHDEAVAVNTLGDQCLAELDVCDQDVNPGDQVGNGAQVLEPVEDGAGTGADAHVGKKRDRGGDKDGVVRNTALGALKEDLGGLTVLSKSEKVTRAAEQEGVG